jgi:NitT/TauT family transport system ATP-binding protein
VGHPAAQVRLRNVGKVFMTGQPPAPLHALGPLDLDIRQGEFFAVVGPSGCGKSTLLELIAGLTPATEGTIEFEGQPIAGEAPDGIGVVFQDDASLPWLNVVRQRGLRLAPIQPPQGRQGQARARRAEARGPFRFFNQLSGAAFGRDAPARVHRAHAGDAAALDSPR